jgi:hypothetical protein
MSFAGRSASRSPPTPSASDSSTETSATVNVSHLTDYGTGLGIPSITKAVRSLESQGIVAAVCSSSPKRGFQTTTYALNLQPMQDLVLAFLRGPSPKSLDAHLRNSRIKIQTHNNAPPPRINHDRLLLLPHKYTVRSPLANPFSQPLPITGSLRQRQGACCANMVRLSCTGGPLTWSTSWEMGGCHSIPQQHGL